jgi:hypothetical protein
LGFPPNRAERCVTELVDAGMNAAIIGEVEPARDGGLRINLE